MPPANQTPNRRFARFLSRYDPRVAAVGKRAIVKLRRLLPGANALVYDNYNALVVAFGPTDRSADALMSVAFYPRWVSVFFARGAELDDPQGLLRGNGKTFRHLVLEDASELDAPAVKRLVAQALALSATPLPARRGAMIVKSVSPKQRPRRAAK